MQAEARRLGRLASDRHTHARDEDTTHAPGRTRSAAPAGPRLRRWWADPSGRRSGRVVHPILDLPWPWRGAPPRCGEPARGGGAPSRVG